MNFSEDTPPAGSVRAWLDHRAEVSGCTCSHQFFDGGPHMTWAEMRSVASGIAERLSGMGVEQGESVALVLPNGRDGVSCLLGVLYGGFRATPINLVAGPRAIAYALSHSGARVAFVGRGQAGLWDQAAAQAITPIRVSMGVEWPVDAHGALPPVVADDDALLMYTSGTTGPPKGAVHTQASLLAGGWTVALAHRLGPEDCALCVLPVYHINGLCVTVMGPLVSGGAVAMPPTFSASGFWSQCAEAGATWFSAVPTIISHLVHGREAPDDATRARLRFGRSASSALAPEVQAAFERRFGIPIVETMGLTETAAQILSNPLPPGPRRMGSPGVPYGNEISILARDSKPLPPGTEGEIAVRGPNLMREYFMDSAATRAAFGPDGWFLTGDLGRMDEDGYVYVTGRRKELIIKGGENIAPREIDEALYAHPDVVEAAAFGRSCPTYGQRVEAAVKLVNGSKLAPRSLIEFCDVRVGSFKCPEAIHILGDLPKGPSGKIQRLKIAEITATAAAPSDDPGSVGQSADPSW